MMSGVDVPTDDAVEAFRSVCRDAIARVYSFAFVRCGNVAVAQDVTSEALVAGARAAAQGQQISLPWLLGVARHKLIDHWRRTDREARHLRLAASADADVEEPID